MREDFVLFSYKYRTDVQRLQQFGDVFIKYFYSFMMKCYISVVKSGTKETQLSCINMPERRNYCTFVFYIRNMLIQ